jgi:hypothetical protein
MVPVRRSPQEQQSERNVVLEIVEAATCRLCGRSRTAATADAATGIPRRSLAHALAATQHLHAVAANLGRIAVLAFLVLPLAGTDGTLDVDLRTLFQVLATDLGLASEVS